MNKPELIEKVAQEAGVDKSIAERVLEAFVQVVISSLKEKVEVTLTGFGTFSARVREARMGVNPRNPSERIQIPTVVVPKFKAGKTLKDALKKGGNAHKEADTPAVSESSEPSHLSSNTAS